MKKNETLNLTNRILLAGLAIGTVVSFVFVPLDQMIPIHWDITGRPDNWAPAPLALLIPAIIAAVVIGSLRLMRRGSLTKDFEAGRHLISAAISIALLIALAVLASSALIGLGHELDMPRMVTGLVGAVLLILGNYMPKSQPNRVAGVRVPWTLRDPANWALVNRRSGQWLMIGGALSVLAALFGLPAPVLAIIAMAAVIVPLSAGTIYSYMLSRS